MRAISQWLFSFYPRKSGQPSKGAAHRAPMAQIQQRLREALAGCQGVRQDRLFYKIDAAQTPVQLWLMRSDLHQCIAQAHSESVAAQRINDVASLFEGWIPADKLTKVQPDFKPSKD